MGVPPPAFRYRTTGNSSNADGSGYPLYLLRICEDRKRMSLLSLTLYAVQKHLLLFPFWLPVVKLKRGFGFIVHDNMSIEFIARIAFHAFDKVGLSFGHKTFYIVKAQQHSAHGTKLKPTASLIGAFYNLVPNQ